MNDPTAVVQVRLELPEQKLFAKLSGDYNPMHLDAVAARRFMFGGIVVHGVHILLKALELLFSKTRENIGLRTVSAQFHHPVRVGSLTEYVFNEIGEGETSVQICVGICTVANIHVSWRSGRTEGIPLASELPSREPCQVLAENNVPVARGQVPVLLHEALSDELFPVLSKYAPAHQIAMLLAATRIVGMKCPGYNSVFSELMIRYSADCENAREASYAVADYDSRFHLASIRITGPGSAGTLKAFLRPPPQIQPPVSDLMRFLRSNEFEGRRALVIGGSRGLGELCAKLLSAGGADIRLTYRSGEHDAAIVVDDINTSGGSAEALRFDVTAGGTSLLKSLGKWRPTELLYFATPPIFQPRYEKYSGRLFEEFTNIYVNSFADIFYALEFNGALRNVLCPSTVAIDDLTRDMPEYIAAKSAAEALCRFLDKTHPDVYFQMPRLPRLLTDQTVNLFGVKGEDALPLLLGLLRKGPEV